MDLSRRQLLGAAGALSLPALLAACGGFSTSGSNPQASSDGNALTFTTWGTDAELAGFRSAIDGFQKANAGTTVTLNAVP